MRRSKLAIISICFVMALGATACSSKEDIPKINMENIDNGETEQKETEQKETEPIKQDDSNAEKISTEEGNTQNIINENKSNHTQDDPSTNNGNSSKDLFANAKLQGSVVEFSDSEISLSMATTTTDENCGDIMAEAAPGMENEDELVHVSYGENMSVRILTMDSASQTQVSLETGDKENIKKQTSVLIFGECQDTYHWTADEVVIVRWQ